MLAKWVPGEIIGFWVLASTLNLELINISYSVSIFKLMENRGSAICVGN